MIETIPLFNLNKEDWMRLKEELKPELLVHIHSGAKLPEMDRDAQFGICSSCIWPEIYEGKVIGETKEALGQNKKSRLNLFADQVDWQSVYHSFGHNESPSFSWDQVYFASERELEMISSNIRADRQTTALAQRLKSTPTLEELANWHAIPLFSPIMNNQFQIACNEAEKQALNRHFDAQLAFALGLAAYEIVHHRSSTTSRQSVKKTKAEIVFKNDLEDNVDEFLRFLGSRLPEKSLMIIEKRKGSTQLALRLSDVDALLLQAIINSGIYQHLERDFLHDTQPQTNQSARSEILDASFDIDLLRVPIKIVDFADDLVSIGDGIGGRPSGRARLFYDLKNIWEDETRISSLRDLVSESSSIYNELSRCG
ncbi:MAG: hypothetical protein ABJ205_13480 [Erythrobacter sp.]|uniref:hypothetical protein n=1 Tax=Erythrobacter sp. TaxID=1042 RepID=UPI003265F0B6